MDIWLNLMTYNKLVAVKDVQPPVLCSPDHMAVCIQSANLYLKQNSFISAPLCFNCMLEARVVILYSNKPEACKVFDLVKEHAYV